MKNISEHELIDRCLERNQEAFAELVSRYKKLIYSTVYYYIKDNEEVNDISQEVFFRIYKSLGSFNRQYKFSTWAVKITSNLCLDIIRKKKVNSVAMDEIESLSIEDDTPERQYLSRERMSEIQKAIEQLPEKYRTPIIMYHKYGKSYKDISAILNEPMSIIKNRIYRARLALRENLAGI